MPAIHPSKIWKAARCENQRKSKIFFWARKFWEAQIFLVLNLRATKIPDKKMIKNADNAPFRGIKKEVARF